MENPVEQLMEDDRRLGEFNARLDSYREKCDVLKQIHSNRSLVNKTWYAVVNIIIIISSIVVTSFGFLGADKLSKFFTGNTDNGVFDMVWNIIVLILLIISVVNISIRFQERYFDHYRAVIVLSGL